MNHGNIAFFVPHMGCPHRCSFCDQNVITGSGDQRPPTPEEVETTCAAAAQRLGDRAAQTQIAFFGGSFTAIPRETMTALLKPAAKAVKEFGFAGIRCSTRPDAITPEILDLLARYGVNAVELGAQSMSDRVLALNRRGHTAEQVREASRLIRGRGMELGLQMMTGLYGDSDASALQTAEELIALAPDTARVYPTVVLPGTYLTELYEQGLYRPQTLEEAVRLCAVIVPRFESAGVRVIRVGLHAERELEERKLAGPYHPSFRELVQSRVFLESLLPELKRRGPGAYEIAVNPRTVSAAVGEKKENLARLWAEGFAVRVIQDDRVERGRFTVR